MAIIYTESPLLAGSHVTTAEMFVIGQTRDYDVWPEISILGLDETSNREYASCGGRIRTPMIGGGASNKMYFALRDLMHLMEADERRVGPKVEQRDLFGAYPHRKRKYVERHMDDGSGYIGLEILAGGVVRLRMRPRDGDNDRLQTEVEIFLRPDTPYIRTYVFMVELWKAIAKDNKKLGAFRGNHAW